ncbi:hypothetical protein RRG08_060265 [Elysia crispata]|uniref:Uncharacterized protein n=1 Tax=Elysia crispata TaxID=231223 RepID=A0AAE1B6S7_9GAST|nr:hypothetical protein RRG08_060265 [Elysia crispata]
MTSLYLGIYQDLAFLAVETCGHFGRGYHTHPQLDNNILALVLRHCATENLVSLLQISLAYTTAWSDSSC